MDGREKSRGISDLQVRSEEAECAVISGKLHGWAQGVAWSFMGASLLRHVLVGRGNPTSLLPRHGASNAALDRVRPTIGAAPPAARPLAPSICLGARVRDVPHWPKAIH